MSNFNNLSKLDESVLASVFKAYDIRGKYPQEISSDFYYQLGLAYATLFKPKKVAVANDIKDESPMLKDSLAQGLLDSGVSVVDIGQAGTEMHYFVSGEYASELDGSLIVTSSHNPAGWNGCKIVTKGAKPVGKETGLFDLRDLMISQNYEKVSTTQGTLEQRDIFQAYKDKVLSFITNQPIPLKVVVDAGNGVGGILFDRLFSHLPIEVTKLFFEPDGTFPNHVPNPLKEENVVELRQEMSTGKYDIGIAIDGDADRVFFIDKKCRKPDGAYMGVLIAKNILGNSNEKNARIIHDKRVTWPVEKEIKKLEAVPVASIAGHSYIKQKMAEENAVFGAELSTHFFYRDFYNADAGMVTIAIVLNMIYGGFDLTSAVDYLFETYPNSGEVNFYIEDTHRIMDALEKFYSDMSPTVDKIDGLSMQFDAWRFNLRASNTEPIVRLNVEGVNKDVIVKNFKDLEKIIGGTRENTPALAELI